MPLHHKLVRYPYSAAHAAAVSRVVCGLSSANGTFSWLIVCVCAGASDGTSSHDSALFGVLQRQQQLGLLRSAGTEDLMRRYAGRGGRGRGRGGRHGGGRGRHGCLGRHGGRHAFEARSSLLPATAPDMAPTESADASGGTEALQSRPSAEVRAGDSAAAPAAAACDAAVAAADAHDASAAGEAGSAIAAPSSVAAAEQAANACSPGSSSATIAPEHVPAADEPPAPGCANAKAAVPVAVPSRDAETTVEHDAPLQATALVQHNAEPLLQPAAGPVNAPAAVAPAADMEQRTTEQQQLTCPPHEAPVAPAAAPEATAPVTGTQGKGNVTAVKRKQENCTGGSPAQGAKRHAGTWAPARPPQGLLHRLVAADVRRDRSLLLQAFRSAAAPDFATCCVQVRKAVCDMCCMNE